MHPAPLIVTCPQGTPTEVSKAAATAAQLVWSDPAASANRLRTAIEELLTAQRINRYTRKNHKQIKMTTHARIELFQKKQQSIGDLLMAVKWIGNAGSHEGELDTADVLEGADLLSLALVSLYDKSAMTLVARAAKIIKNKGPAKGKKAGKS